jgi:hypothetical protein
MHNDISRATWDRDTQRTRPGALRRLPGPGASTACLVMQGFFASPLEKVH